MIEVSRSRRAELQYLVSLSQTEFEELLTEEFEKAEAYLRREDLLSDRAPVLYAVLDSVPDQFGLRSLVVYFLAKKYETNPFGTTVCQPSAVANLTMAYGPIYWPRFSALMLIATEPPHFMERWDLSFAAVADGHYLEAPNAVEKAQCRLACEALGLPHEQITWQEFQAVINYSHGIQAVYSGSTLLSKAEGDRVHTTSEIYQIFVEPFLVAAGPKFQAASAEVRALKEAL